MFTVTVKIAASGTVYDGDGESLTGHLWLSVDSDGPSGYSVANSYGFAPNVSIPLWQGHVHNDDDQKYASTYYTGTIVINEPQYNQLKAFGSGPETYGFSMIYSAVNNSCVDFTWMGLTVAGINSSWFEGEILPTSNANNVDEALYSHLFGGTSGWHADWSSADGYDVIYGSQYADNLQAQPNDNVIYDAVYGGAGNDKLTGSGYNDKLFGGDNNDVLEGVGGNDYLEGGKGNDRLEGGAGDDIYILQKTGGGIDRIKDHSGNDQIKVDGVAVSGEFSPGVDGGQIYYSADKVYQFQELSGGTWRLSAKAAGAVEYTALADIEGWQAGEFGISWGAAVAVARLAFGFPNGIVHYHLNGSSATQGVDFVGSAQSDSFYGSGYNDHITTGDDRSTVINGVVFSNTSAVINAYGGDDWVQGGDSRDYLRTGTVFNPGTVSDNDLAFGGAQSDVLLGGYGSDQLWGDADDGHWLLQGADSGGRGDWLSGESGRVLRRGIRRGKPRIPRPLIPSISRPFNPPEFPYPVGYRRQITPILLRNRPR